MSIKSASKRVFTSRWFILGAALVALYSLAGFLLLPYLARHYLKQYIEQRLDHQLVLAELRFNPFTFTVEAERLGVTDKNSSPVTNLAFLFADFDLLSSLYHRAWTFSDIRMTDPLVHVVLKQEGGSNLSDLLKGLKGDEESEAPQAESREMPRILLEDVALRDGKITLIDRRRSPPADVRLRSISIDLEELTTLPKKTGGYMVSGRTKAGERLKGRGRISLNPLRSEGSLRMESVKAATLWEFLKNRIRCDEPPGEFSVQGEYLLDFGREDPEFVLSSLGFDVSDLSVTLPGEQSPLIVVEKMNGREGRLHWNEHTLSLETLRVEGGRMRAEVGEAGLANWRKLASGGQARIEKDPGDVSQEGTDEMQGLLLKWAASLRSFKLKGFQVQVTDLTTDPPATFSLGSVDLGLEGLSTDRTEPVAFRLHTRVEEEGALTASGKARPWDRKAEGHVEIAGFPVVPLQPYLDRLVRLTLESGEVNASGEFSYGSDEGELLTYRGQGEIISFQARTEDGERHPWGWDTLSCAEIRLSLSPYVLDLGTVSVTEPSGRLIIYEDRTVSLSRIMVQEKERKAESSGRGFRFAAERLRVEKGALEFADLSLKPQFGAFIHDLQGSITGVSSISETVAKLELEGRVDKHGLVRIRGETDLFSPAGTTDITMDFRNIEMTELTPYSIRFLGYRIASGKLALDLHYSIRDGKMEGRNQILAEQFMLGERVESPSALDLPFELAIALLKDSKGTIDIGVPVSGDLNNPEFELGEVVRKAMANLLGKIVTAPFGWLAALVGSEKENLDTIFFYPGKAVLTPPEKEKLIELSEALEKRPLLELRIQGGYDPEVDVPALKALLIRNRVASRKEQAFDPVNDPGPLVFHNPETQKALEALFLEYAPPEVLGELRAGFQENLPRKWRQDEKEKAAAWVDFYKDLHRRIEQKIEIPENRLEALAEARAASVGQFLAKSRGVKPGRIKVLEPTRTGGRDGKEVKSRLSLEVSGKSGQPAGLDRNRGQDPHREAGGRLQDHHHRTGHGSQSARYR